MFPIIPMSRRKGFYQYEVKNSALFTRETPSYVSWTQTYSGDRTKWTFRTLCKIQALGVIQTLLSVYSNSNNYNSIYINENGKLNLNIYDGGIQNLWRSNEALLDVTGLYDLEMQYDSGQAVANNRFRVWINGRELTPYTNTITLNRSTQIFNATRVHYLGVYYNGSTFSNGFSGVMADTVLASQTAPGEPVGGSFDADTGVWLPNKPEDAFDLATTSGANYLFKWADDLDIAANSIETNPTTCTASDVYQRTDTPTNNQAAGDALYYYSGTTITYNNTLYTAGTNVTAFGQLDKYVPPTGKWVMEFQNKSVSGSAATGCYLRESPNGPQDVHTLANQYYVRFDHHDGAVALKDSTHDGSTWEITGMGAARDIDDVAAIAVDMDTGDCEFYINGVLKGSLNIPWLINNPHMLFTGTMRSTVSNSSFKFRVTPENLAYTYPDYECITAQAQGEPDVMPKEGAGNALFNGTSTSQFVDLSIIETPDFFWWKCANSTGHNGVVDSVRGPGHELYLNLSNPDATAGIVESLDIGGVTVSGAFGSSYSYAGFCLKKGPEYGFSIVSRAGNTGNADHNLGGFPDVIWSHAYTGVGGAWFVHLHPLLTSIGETGVNTKVMYLNSSSERISDSIWRLDTSATQLIPIGSEVNTASVNYIHYCWRSIPGFSKFGAYNGNGQTGAFGPHIKCGFRPSRVVIKCIDAAYNWNVLDSGLNTHNPSDSWFSVNTSDAAFDGEVINITSQGFKVANNASSLNASGYNYMYMAWAAEPGCFSNAY